MITKAIVSEIVSPFEVKIRVPIFDSIEGQTLATANKDLTVATICSLPNCYPCPQVGDVVFVGFEDNTTHKAVILGHLSREAVYSTYPNININDLEVIGTTKLSKNTSIGDVSAKNIQMLEGVSGNIQKQIELLSHRIAVIEDLLKDAEVV